MRDGTPVSRGRQRSAVVTRGDRSAALLLSSWQRQFRLSLRAGRSTMLAGPAPDLVTAAAPARLWLGGARPGEVAARWPFLGSVALAEARERGDRRETMWLHLSENHYADPLSLS
ncbi:hypothetical protein [Actinoplanes palleronii]|uniref:Uncharacterized protein n=1 Tax=Actinoplanes palleronii TaxID=113570 RepID=A0ABQ4AZQ7_9ACTN|nr:hypothetical protein [Actinoplanes palleronii]GIE63922.1 hypothetical protein Apa02nite_000300 [Actinoplanes palleronii]